MAILGKTYVLNFSDRCNQNCIFCFNGEPKNQTKVTYKKIRKEIQFAKDNKVEKLDFFGGEPTLYPFFVRSIRYANKLKLPCMLATNCIKFSSKSYARNFFSKVKVFSVRTSLHSYKPEVHDRITRIPGSFEKTIKGIRNIVKYFKSPRFCINIVITELNYKDLVDMVKFVAGLRVFAIKFSGMTIEGRAKDNLYITVNPSLVRGHLFKAIKLAQDLRLYYSIEKMPVCISDGLKTEPSDFMQENRENFIKFKTCHSCDSENYCVGLEYNLLEKYGIPFFYRFKKHLRMLYKKNKHSF